MKHQCFSPTTKASSTSNESSLTLEPGNLVVPRLFVEVDVLLTLDDPRRVNRQCLIEMHRFVDRFPTALVIVWSSKSREYAVGCQAVMCAPGMAMEKHPLAMKSLIRPGDIVVDQGHMSKRTHWCWEPFAKDAQLFKE